MTSALILIDIQNDYFKGGKNELYCPEQAAVHAKRVLECCRNNGLPMCHVQHISVQKGATFFLPDTSGIEIHESVLPRPDEKIFIKHAPNAFFQTGLADELVRKNIDHLIVCGMMTHMCIDTTVRAAKDLGFSVTVLQDACATKELGWDDIIIPAITVHHTIMASLQGTFAKILSTDAFLESIHNDKTLL